MEGTLPFSNLSYETRRVFRAGAAFESVIFRERHERLNLSAVSLLSVLLSLPGRGRPGVRSPNLDTNQSSGAESL